MNNWHDISDDELDGIFRDSADKHEVEFEQASWDKMTQKLDLVNSHSVEPQKTNSWIVRGLIPLSLLLLILIGTVIYRQVAEPNEGNSTKVRENVTSINKSKPNDVDTNKVYTRIGKSNLDDLKTNENAVFNQKISSTEPLENDTETIQKQDVTKPDFIKTEKEKLKLPENSSTKPTLDRTKSKREEVAEVDKIENQHKKINKTSKQYLSEKESKASQKNIYSKSKTSSAQNNPSSNLEGKDFEVKSIDNQLVIITPELDKNGELEPSKTKFVYLTPIPNRAINLHTKFDLPAIHSPISVLLENKMPSSPVINQFKKGLSLRLVYSPDLSLILGDKIGKIGRNIGVLAEYRLNNRLSINSGVVRSLKYYEAYPEDYTWIWNQTNTPLTEINATCDMLDIPLNIRYDITQKNNSRLFTSVGFTSYVMLNEIYKYNYVNNYDPSIKWKQWEGKTGAYPFSILNFSAGYERQIFRKISIQAEPFIKIPLGQVGFGKVKLASMGVFFSAKYPLFQKK